MMKLIGVICALTAIVCSGYGTYLLIKEDQTETKKDKVMTVLGAAAMIAVLILAAAGVIEIIMGN